MFSFFRDTPTTDIYTLSLHDALPIYLSRDQHHLGGRIRVDAGGGVQGPARRLACRLRVLAVDERRAGAEQIRLGDQHVEDRKSTRLNSSHLGISYAVFCLKKKTKAEV